MVFYQEDLTGLDFAGAELSGGLLIDSRLDGARLDGALVYDALAGGVILRGASLVGANFVKAQMLEADLTEVDARDAIFVKTDLLRARLDRGDFRGASFDQADCHDASFVGADLRGAELRRTRLNGADLSGARLEGVSLDEVLLSPETRLAGATGLDRGSFERVNLDGEILHGEEASATLDALTHPDAPERIRRLLGRRAERPKLLGAVMTIKPEHDPEHAVALLEREIGTSGQRILDVADLDAGQALTLRREIEAQPYGHRVRFWP